MNESRSENIESQNYKPSFLQTSSFQLMTLPWGYINARSFSPSFPPLFVQPRLFLTALALVRLGLPMRI